MKKIKKYKIKKYIIISIPTLIITLISIFLLLYYTKTEKIKTLDNDYYTFLYDKSWNIKTKEKEKIILHHPSNSTITINITKLEDNNKYQDIDSLIDDIIYSISKNNENYNLIYKEKTKLTENEYYGYKILYEKESTEILFDVYKQSDKLITIIYESTDEYFDILLDSVNNIIYNCTKFLTKSL